MSKLYHFFRLIRGLNLLVMVFTMYAVQIFILRYSEIEFSFDYQFFFLVLSLCLIAAAGNIINDYFDVKADRINKPERLIIDKYIKRRWAIMFNWIFNFLGFSIALYISLKKDDYNIIMLATGTIVLLWLYSMVLKKKVLIGNITVALMVALVPLYALVYYSGDFGIISTLINRSREYYIVAVIVGFAACAFLINLIREITKDIFDIRGDKKIDATTFPIRYGVKKSKGLIFLIAAIYIICLCFLFFRLRDQLFSMNFTDLFIKPSVEIVVSILAVFVISFLAGLFVTLLAKSLKSYKWSSNLYKLAMLAGVTLILFL